MQIQIINSYLSDFKARAFKQLGLGLKRVSILCASKKIGSHKIWLPCDKNAENKTTTTKKKKKKKKHGVSSSL